LPAALLTALYVGLFGAALSVLRPLTPADAAAAGRLNPRLGAVVERMVDR
jgi:hypothetical protein